MKISDKYIFSDSMDIALVKKALNSEMGLSGTSEIVREYEEKLGAFFGLKFGVAVSSGTAALQVALFSLGIKKGDEVVVSSTCPLMTVLPIIAIGARPVFCDTEEENFGLDIDDLKKIISTKTKAIIEVPMWGYPTSVDKSREFIRSKKIPLILDLAQAHGTTLGGKYLSAYGDISCFSTHERKILSTGEGGFLFTGEKALYKRSKSFSQFGFMNGKDFGLNYKLSGLQAALGISRIGFIDKQLAIRARNAKYLTERIENPFIKEFHVIKNSKPNYYTLLLKLNFRDNKRAINKMIDQGVPSDIAKYKYRVLYEFPIFKKYRRRCKKSEKLVKSITTIPVHPGLKRKDLDYILKVINNINA